MARARGFATWNPSDKSRYLLHQVRSVLDEYEKFLPLTARQIFYRLVGQYGYDKTERAYANLCEMLVRARRSGRIPFDSIRDDGTQGGAPLTYAGVEGFWQAVRDDLKHYSRDRLADQPVAVELWCEAGGMVPQLQRVAYPYSVPVFSTGGFSSVTVTYEIAKRAIARAVPTVFLHVGDYDPSGESIFDAMSGDAREFVEQATWDMRERMEPEMGEEMGLSVEQIAAVQDSDADPELRPVRVALTAAQVREHGLPTAPPKKSDTRSRNWRGETCQLEAMPPEQLAATVRNAIRGVIDVEMFDAEVGREKQDKADIEAGLERAADDGSG